ncbi:MAG: hypothetical protein IT437_11845 [Phycisphaerales bacterium]|nr:hypothetical protein [Phycisphaerales bacterium]
MNRRTGAVVTLALAAFALGGCTSLSTQSKPQAALSAPSMVAGDPLGSAIFARDTKIAWAKDRPAPAFAQFPTRD